ncbi:MAG TPA: phosphate acyltransferase PlsX [Anaerolineaceae bacterium]|nr:phosphate acyltransferase PlsX [Anaerolineaceae bacterium]
MRTTIVLDAMGSDERPKPELAAAVLSTQTDDIDLILVGDEQTLSSGLAAQPGDKSHIRIVHAPEAIDMTDHIQEARAKKQNTMQVGMDLVRKGEAQAFVTAGNTGMAMYFGTKIFGLMPGVIRPCLSTTFPVKGGKAVILDIGANAECRPEFLVQFGQMGQVYARIMLNRTNPTVGLLSNGEEEGKGNDLVREAGPLMRQQVPGFIGNIEGKEFFGGKVDVAVTDGFTGNVLMKSSEALGKLLFETLKEELMRSTRTKLGALLAKPAFDSVRKLIDPSEVGAAPLLGLDGLVFVGHGRSDAKAMVSAINQARIAIELNLLESLRKAITFTNTKESDS